MAANSEDQIFRFHDKRQERIYRRLGLVGPGAAAFYKDACHLMSEERGFETTTHLIGHCLREVESMIRAVLGIYRTDATKGHEVEIRAILKGLDIDETDGVAALWLKHTNRDSGLHKRTHRDNLYAPRPVDAEFRGFWNEMESVFDTIIGKFEAKYLSVHENLDSMLAIADPSNDDAKWLNAKVPNNDAALGYFFRKLNNPKWLGPLRAEGLFQRPAEPIYEHETETMLFPPWPLSQYLVRMAAFESLAIKNEVQQILLEIESINFIIHLDILDAASLLPGELAAPVAEKENIWLENQRHIGHLLPDKIGTLVNHLAKNNQSVAFDLMDTALSLVPNTQSSESLSPTDELFGVQPKARLELWDYGQLTHKCIEALVTADWRASFQLFSSVLNQFLDQKYSGRDSNRKMAYSFIWHRAIESDDSGFENLLVSIVRKSAELSLDADLHRFAELIAILDSYSWLLFERVVLHLLRKYPQQLPDEASNRLLNHANFLSDELFHEYVILLRDSFQNLSAQDQNMILEWIDKSWNTDNVKERARESGNELSVEDAEKQVRWRKLKWLEPLKDVLPEDWKAKHDQWVDELGHPDHPEYLLAAPRIIWGGGPPEPPSADVLSKMEIPEITEYLLNEPNEPPELLGRELSGLVANDIAKFAASCQMFEGLAEVYVLAFFDGLKNNTQSIPKPSWAKVVTLAKWAIANFPREAKPIDEGGGWETNGSQLWPVIGDLLSAEFGTGIPGIPLELSGDVFSILKSLIDEPASAFEHLDDSNMDPFTQSLNTVRGAAFHTLFKYIYWSNQVSKKNGGESTGFEMMPEIRDLLEAHLDPGIDKSIGIRAVYGERLPFLCSFDADWVKQNLPSIFPEGAELDELRKATWETFIIYTNPYNGVFDLIKDEYTKAVERLDEKTLYSKSEGPSNNLAEHLNVFYATGKISYEPDGLLARFYQKASDSLCSHIFWYVGRMLDRGDIPDEVITRLKNLVEKRIEESKSGDPKPLEMASFGWLFASGKFDPDWAILKLKDTLEISGKSNPDTIIEALAAQSHAFPNIVMECIGLLVDGSEDDWKLSYWRGHIKTSISEAIRSGANEQAKLLVNKLAARGIDFRELL